MGRFFVFCGIIEDMEEECAKRTERGGHKIKLLKDKAKFKVGNVFILGLHGVPNMKRYENTKAEDWYWLEGSKVEEGSFLIAEGLVEGDFEVLEKENKEKKRKEQEKTTIAKKKFLKTFEDSLGSVTATCGMLGIGRRTFYDWKEKDDDFKKEVERIRWLQLDYTEDKLITKIRAGNLGAVMFALQNRHPEYANKLKVDKVDENASVEDILMRQGSVRLNDEKNNKNRKSKSESGADIPSKE